MAITPLPTPPSRQDPFNFATRADAFLGQLPDFATEANDLATEVNGYATTAQGHANTASSAAITAGNAATTAQGYATSAQGYMNDAEAAAIEAAGLTEKYQGALVSDPTLDKEGNPLTAGDWYVNTTSGFLRVYNGTAWVQGVNAISGVSSLNGQTGALTGFVTETDTQTLTNKTINFTNNTLTGVQPTLVSGTNIKTIGGVSVLGSGNITVGTGDVTGPVSSTANAVCTFSGTTGKVLQDSTKLLPSGDIVGSSDSQTITNKTINASNNTITNVSLTASVTGTLPVTNGGTGATSLTANAVLLGNGSSTIQAVNPSTSGNVLTSNGTTWVSSAPTGASTSANNTFTGSNTFGNASGQVFLASGTTTQDGIVVNGRAGGSSSFRVTLSPSALTASRSVTFPDATGNVVLDTATQTLTNKTINASNNSITNISLSSSVTGTLPVGNGGTGATTLTGIVKGNGTSAFTAAVAGTDYQAPLVSGTNIKTINSTSILGSGNITVGDVTTTGAQTLSTKTLTTPRYTVDNDGTISGGTWAIDYNNGPLIKATVGAAITSVTLSNLPASGTLGHLKLMLVNPGAFAITFPAAWKFIKSDFTTTNFAGLGVTLPASGVVFFDLITDDAGSNVYVTISRN